MAKKKPAAKKAAAKKTAAKKTAAKTAAKKTAAKKAATKKMTKQVAAKQPAAKQTTKQVAAKQPAAKQPAAKQPVLSMLPQMAARGSLRGGALADYAIELHRKANPGISGLDASTVNKRKLGSKHLSPALVHWLRADSELFTLGEPQAFPALVASEFPEYEGFFAAVGTKYLTGTCVLFEGWGADSRRFLYLGAVDGHGEYPVFTLDTDDTPFLCLNGPVDVWLAQQVGAIDEEETYGQLPAAYEPARKALAKQCFGGYLAHIDGEFTKTLS